MLAADEAEPRHAGTREIVDEATLAEQQAPVFFAGWGRADHGSHCNLPAMDPASLDAGATRYETPCGAGRMVWRAWGAGTPVVLLHGGSGSWTHWVRNVNALGRRHRVLAADMPGFGDSDSPPPPETVETLARVVAGGLDALLPPPGWYDVLGFSFGGIVGGLVAARQRERVRTLVFIGTGGMGFPRSSLPALVRVPPDGDDREAHRENLRRLMLGDPARADDLAVAIHRDNVRRARFRTGSAPDSDVLLRALPSVTARLAGIWGTRDAFAVPYLDARRATLARFRPDVDFRLVEGAGHWVNYEAAATVNAALVDILG
jgi:pimeloyl-ACP methyl ester carboxylesterase